MTKIPASTRLRLCTGSLVITIVFAFTVVVIETHVNLLVYTYLGVIFILHGIEVYGATRS